MVVEKELLHHDILRVLDARRLALHTDVGMASGFRQEMRRFLPADLVSKTVDQPPFWDALTVLIDDLCTQTRLRCVSLACRAQFCNDRIVTHHSTSSNSSGVQKIGGA